MDFFSPTRDPTHDNDKEDNGSDMSITLELPGLKHARSPTRRMQEQSCASSTNEPRPTQRRRLTLEQPGDNDNTGSSFRTANDVNEPILDDDSDMELTQPITTEQPTNTRQQESLPFDYKDDGSDMSPNRVFSGVPEDDRDLLSPIAARGIRSPQALYSPRRTFYLHGNNTPGRHPSPMRLAQRVIPKTTTAPASPLPPSRLSFTPTAKPSPSPRRYSVSSRTSIYTRRTDDQSVNLDEMMDRMIDDQNSKSVDCTILGHCSYWMIR